MFHETIFPFSLNAIDSASAFDLIPLPTIPPLYSVFLNPASSSVSADSIVQLHHDVDEDAQDIPDALDPDDSNPPIVSNVRRRYTRISKPPSYLKAYHCN